MSDFLTYPSHFPPTTRWKKFFNGVRWLGPDLSFFKELKAIQAARSENMIQIWGGGIRQEIAETIGEILSKRLGWASKVFLPGDHFYVVAHGPRFDQLDDYALEEAIEAIEEKYNITIPNDLLGQQEYPTFDMVVDGILGLINA